MASFSAVRWTSFAMSARSLLAFLQIAILARLLVPADFGLMAIVASIVAVLSLFADLGLGKAIIHRSRISHSQLSSLYWLNLAASILLMICLIGVAPIIGTVYGDERLTSILIVSSFIFPLTAFGHQFRILAEKRLEFSTLAWVEILSAVFSFAVAVLVAIADGGVWAIVAAMLTGAMCSSIFSYYWLSSAWSPGWRFRFHDCRSFLGFGGFSMGETLANTVRMQSDVFIGGLMFGPSALGMYSLPRDLSLRISFVINPIVTRVGLPVMAKAQEDKPRLKNMYLRTLRMTSSINFPIYLALALFAEEAVHLIFGNQWTDAAIYLQIFAIMGLIRSTGNPSGSLLYAVGRARRAFVWNMSLLVVVPPVFVIGAYIGGLEGLAWSMLIIQVAIFIPAWRFLVLPLCGATFLEYLKEFLPPLFIALVATGCAYGLGLVVDKEIWRLGLGLSLGLVVYLLVSLRFNRPWVAAMQELLFPKKQNQGGESA